MSTLRDHVLVDVAELLAEADTLGTFDVNPADRVDELEAITHAIRLARVHKPHNVRDLLLQLARETMLWIEQIDTAEVMNITAGEEAA